MDRIELFLSLVMLFAAGAIFWQLASAEGRAMAPALRNPLLLAGTGAMIASIFAVLMAFIPDGDEPSKYRWAERIMNYVFWAAVFRYIYLVRKSKRGGTGSAALG